MPWTRSHNQFLFSLVKEKRERENEIDRKGAEMNVEISIIYMEGYSTSSARFGSNINKQM